MVVPSGQSGVESSDELLPNTVMARSKYWDILVKRDSTVALQAAV